MASFPQSCLPAPRNRIVEFQPSFRVGRWPTDSKNRRHSNRASSWAIVRLRRSAGAEEWGEVYLAKQHGLERPVAVKILPPGSGSSEAIDLFLREARAASHIDHPNVVTIHSVGEQAGLYYIVMQWVHGKNLAELVQEHRGPLPWKSAVRIVQLAATGLHAVNSHRLVHRDIKPSNIMLSTKSRVLLMDFGLVHEEADLTRTPDSKLAGTPPYMSPEQCRGEGLDGRSDIFSLGSTLYFLLTAKPPYRGTAGSILGQIASGKKPHPIAQFNPAVHEDVAAVVAKAMSPEIDDRYPTAAVMAKQLRDVLRRRVDDKIRRGVRVIGVGTPQVAPVGREPSPGAAEREKPLEAEVIDVQQEGIPQQALRDPQDDLEQIELLPLTTTTDIIQSRLPWVATAIAAALLALMLTVAVIAPLMHRSSRRPSSGASPTAGMVRIPAGYARLGNDPEKLREFLSAYLTGRKLESALDAMTQESQQRLFVPTFYIDRYEVTNAEYADFIKATSREAPSHFIGNDPPRGKEDHPVVNVDYNDAEAYAVWAGKKLPTREQWMRAFRGDTDHLFPWGDDYSSGRANVGDNPKFPTTSPIRDTPQDVTSFEVYNMVGNVSELIRGVHEFEGKRCRIGKGSEYKMSGFTLGVGCFQFRYGLTTSERGLGFRCVLEQE